MCDDIINMQIDLWHHLATFIAVAHYFHWRRDLAGVHVGLKEEVYFHYWTWQQVVGMAWKTVTVITS